MLKLTTPHRGFSGPTTWQNRTATTGLRQTIWLFTNAADKLNQGLPGTNSTSGQNRWWTWDLWISRQSSKPLGRTVSAKSYPQRRACQHPFILRFSVRIGLAQNNTWICWALYILFQNGRWFMWIQIGPCCLVQDKIFFWILSLRTRHQGLIWIKTKEYLNGSHFGIRCIGSTVRHQHSDLERVSSIWPHS